MSRGTTRIIATLPVQEGVTIIGQLLTPLGFVRRKEYCPRRVGQRKQGFPARIPSGKGKKVRALSWVSWLLLIVGSAIREEEERAGYDQVKQRPSPSLGSLVEKKD